MESSGFGLSVVSSFLESSGFGLSVVSSFLESSGFGLPGLTGLVLFHENSRYPVLSAVSCSSSFGVTTQIKEAFPSSPSNAFAGMVYVFVTVSPTVKYDSNYGMGLTSVDFSWTEVGDLNNQEDWNDNGLVKEG